MEQKLHNELEAMRQELEGLEEAYEQDREGFWGLSKNKWRVLQARLKYAKASRTLESLLRQSF